MESKRQREEREEREERTMILKKIAMCKRQLDLLTQISDEIKAKKDEIKWLKQNNIRFNRDALIRDVSRLENVYDEFYDDIGHKNVENCKKWLESMAYIGITEEEMDAILYDTDAFEWFLRRGNYSTKKKRSRRRR